MSWLDQIADQILEQMVYLAWHQFVRRFSKSLCQILRKKLGINVSLRNTDLEVIHQSCHYIIVNKCYDVLINSNSSEDEVTVQMQLRQHFPALANQNLGHEFRFAHRLDFATSGLLCIALHKKAAAAAVKCFVHKRVDKYYLALVRGHVSKEMLDIYLPIDYPATKLLLKPITGRRHQLRIHLSESGHTIVGDFTYSNRHDLSPFRMFLHAYRLVLPSEFEYIDVKTEDPFSESDPRNKWVPVETLHELIDETFVKLKLGRKWYQKNFS
nr:RNA pseudouridylate synthase domain-containing protein 1-like isoform X2 [Procambarus clarkii]